MRNFNREAKSFSGRSGGRDSERQNFRKENRDSFSMTRAICDKCKKPCEVPFRPTAGKPVYCNDCFRNQNNISQDRFPRRDFNNRQQISKPNFESNEIKDLKKSLELISLKLDKINSLLENFNQVKTSQKTEKVERMIVSLPKKETEEKEIKKEAKKK